jgi:hypothetical protein
VHNTLDTGSRYFFYCKRSDVLGVPAAIGQHTAQAAMEASMYYHLSYDRAGSELIGCSQ